MYRDAELSPWERPFVVRAFAVLSVNRAGTEMSLSIATGALFGKRRILRYPFSSPGLCRLPHRCEVLSMKKVVGLILALILLLSLSILAAAEEAVRTGDRIKYFMKVVMWIGKGGMKYFDQAATIIALTLGKAMGSSGRAMNWAVLLTSPVFKSAIPTVQADTGLHPVLSRLPVFKDWCVLDAAFDLVDHHPEGAVIGMADTEHMMEKHITHKDGKMHLWCKEIEDYLYAYITPEREREALMLKDGNNMILSSGRRDEGGVNNAMRNPATSRSARPAVSAGTKNRAALVSPRH